MEKSGVNKHLNYTLRQSIGIYHQCRQQLRVPKAANDLFQRCISSQPTLLFSRVRILHHTQYTKSFCTYGISGLLKKIEKVLFQKSIALVYLPSPNHLSSCTYYFTKKSTSCFSCLCLANFGEQ